MGLITDIIKGLPIAAVQEEKIKQFERDCLRLETDHKKLSLHCASLEKENSELKQQLASMLAPRMRRAQEEETILCLLWRHSDIRTEEVILALSHDPERTKYYLEDLEKSGLIDAMRSLYESTRWSLSQEGRRYIIDKGLMNKNG